VVTSEFFETLQIPLLRGRYLTEQDHQGSAWVAVVNETFAREFFPGIEALGQVIHLTAGPEERPREIVGVVADYTQWTPRRPVEPEVHTSHFQQGREIPGNFQGQRFRSKLVVRSSTGTIKPDMIAKIVAGFDKGLAVYGVRSLKQHMTRSTVDIRFYANTLGLFSAIALVLSAIGIYGLMNYSVTDRFHEIGIRLSLGATRACIVWLIVFSGLKLAGAGILVGIAGALAATRLLQVVLFGVQPWDPVTFSIVALFLFVIAMTACVIPALRVTIIDPVRALRAE
jgi:putative ABC transport system permease protein